MTGRIDVFISYKREERALSEQVKHALIGAGYTAVTDLNIDKNEDFGDAIDTMIRTATLTLVLWTEASAASDWVRKEARLARDLEKAGKNNFYLGVMIEDVDLDMPPDLRGLQMVDIHDGGLDELGMAQLLKAARDILGTEAQQNALNAEADSEALAEEWQLYNLARSINVAASYKRYLARYPNGEFADDARRQLGMFTWYLHPFRRGNTSNTLAAMGIVGTIAATAWGASRDPVVIGVEPGVYTAVVAERDTAFTRAETLEEEKTEAEAQASRAAEAKEAAETALSEAESRINSLRTERDTAFTRAETLTVSDCQIEGKPGIRILELDLCVALDVTKLDFSATVLSDLSPLSGLTALEDLRLGDTKVSDLSPLSGLTALENLWFRDTEVSDLSPLSGLTALKQLTFSFTEVSDLSPLSGLTALKQLTFNYTEVSDLSPLSGLTALEDLRLDGTEVSDLSPLSGLTALKELWLDFTEVSDLSPLSGLTALEVLTLARTDVSDLSPLSGLTALKLLIVPDSAVYSGRDAVLAVISNWSP